MQPSDEPARIEDLPARESFARSGYALIPRLLAPALTDFFWSYIHSKFANGLLTWGDVLVPGTPASYGDSATEGLLDYVQPRVAAVTGRRLEPTYSYLRIYKRGDTLLSHRDRPACEFSLSVNIGQIPDEPWPLFVEHPGAPARVVLRPGDALLYRGIELFHWREPYAGQQLVQVFLHFVDADGPHADQKYDGRRALMLPKTAASMRTA
ncbi:MAG TPA: hypothetical protein VMU08_06640 [Rhizomicrobium sp.]|nr:hypothetical protein [Rhizomicrobium sp.]